MFNKKAREIESLQHQVWKLEREAEQFKQELADRLGKPFNPEPECEGCENFIPGETYTVSTISYEHVRHTHHCALNKDCAGDTRQMGRCSRNEQTPNKE